MNTTINGVIKQWWPLFIAAAAIAIGWGTLQAEVAHNHEEIAALQKCMEDVRSSIGRIEQGIARVEGVLQARKEKFKDYVDEMD